MAASLSASAAVPTQNAKQPHLPPPQTFDILPPLHELLSRIDHASSTATSTADVLTGGGPTSASQPDAEAADALASAALASAETGASYTDQPPLDPKDVPAEVTVAVKARIRRALRELEKLPDMQRSVGEQEDEIEELEARVRAQREVLRGLVGEVRGVLLGEGERGVV